MKQFTSYHQNQNQKIRWIDAWNEPTKPTEEVFTGNEATVAEIAGIAVANTLEKENRRVSMVNRDPQNDLTEDPLRQKSFYYADSTIRRYERINSEYIFGDYHPEYEFLMQLKEFIEENGMLKPHGVDYTLTYARIGKYRDRYENTIGRKLYNRWEF